MLKKITIQRKYLLLSIVTFICFFSKSHGTTQKVPLITTEPTIISMNKVHKTPSSLHFLYKNTIGKIVRSCLTKPWASSLAGWMCDKRFSSYYIKPFINTYDINMHEAENPITHFRTFNDFFIRKLKTDARPFDSHHATVISPADGTLIVIENISQTMHFPVKESKFDLATFLGDKKLAQDYEGGTLLLFRLAPWDYHRFHFPLNCTPSKAIRIKGIYESVHPLAYFSGVQPLTQNERHLTLLKTDCGDVVMISVGALFVGAIKQTYTPDSMHKKGDEAGYFCFGGSTVVLLFKKDILKINPEYVHNSKKGKETSLKMGTTIGTKNNNLIG